jgi:hypothetical protein
MAVDTDTFNESIVPRMGILMRWSALSNQKEVRPSASVPMTIAEGNVKSVA